MPKQPQRKKTGKRGRAPYADPTQIKKPRSLRMTDADWQLVHTAARCDDQHPRPWAERQLIRAARRRVRRARKDGLLADSPSPTPDADPPQDKTERSPERVDSDPPPALRFLARRPKP